MVYLETVKSLSQVHGILKKHLKLSAQWIPRGLGGYEGLAHFAILGDLKFLISTFIYFIIIFWWKRGHKIESLWRIQILWIHFGGSSQNCTIFGVHFSIYRSLMKPKV